MVRMVRMVSESWVWEEFKNGWAMVDVMYRL